MSLLKNLLLASGCVAVLAVYGAASDGPATREGHESQALPCPAVSDNLFSEEVWPKVGARTCLECHKSGGDAEDSRFVLIDPGNAKGAAPDEVLRHNRDAFAAMARVKQGDESRLLLKAVGKLKHGGKRVLEPQSGAYDALARFVEQVTAPASGEAMTLAVARAKDTPPFFNGVLMLDDRRLLRRATLSLAGRLPTEAEYNVVARRGRDGIDEVLDAVMKEDAFFDRLREAFNDIFLLVGQDDLPEHVLSYEHFSETRHWPEKYDLSSIADESARTKARYKLNDDYRAAILGEPMKLIEHIVRENHPFTEIVTADYIMVTPYTARGYGIYDQLKDRFRNPNDPFEYIPVKLKALVARTHDDDEDSASGFYPHAGLLTTFQYLRRYPTTETNRNRARARVFYLQFLGVDVLELAARVQDAAAVTAKFPVPTMQAAECVICHKTVDPVAGLFQDYWKFEGVYGRRKGGWFTDMFPPGFEGESLPDSQRWRALQWLGERTAKDPRFAVAMVEHAYQLLTGRKALRPPKDIDSPLFAARLRAYQAQRRCVEQIAGDFSRTGFNFKNVIKAWVQSDFYRADGLATSVSDPSRQAELDDLGVVRMLSPEQLERKIAAVFGKPWGKLKDELAMLYGGIDSKEVTERAADPSGAMGAVQRMMSDDVAITQTALDFSREPADRRLLPEIEPDVVPGSSQEADGKIRKSIVHLHQLILGRDDKPDSAEVDRTYRLFADIVAEAAKRKNIDPQEIWWGRQGLLKPVPDSKYTVRAWRAVITYLLRRQEFLYE